MRVAEKFFRVAVGSSVIRTKTIDWNALSYTPSNLDELDSPFTQQELFSANKRTAIGEGIGSRQIHWYLLQKNVGI